MWSAIRSLGFLLAALIALSAGPALAQTTLRLSLPVSLDSPTGQNIREFARQVRARTGGSLTIDILDGAYRREEYEVIPAVSSGAVDIGATSLHQLASDVPLAKAFLQPFLFNFDALVQAATGPESEIRAMIDKEIEQRTKTRVLWWQPYGSNVIFSKGVLATDPAALAARAIGATDDQTAELMKICGGVPRRLPPADFVTSLQRGTIEAAAVDIMNVREHDLWRGADTITKLRHAPSLFVIVIGERAWRRLTSEQREILTELAQDAQAYMWARFTTVRAEAFAFAADKGMRIVELSTGDVSAWRACSAPLLETYLEAAGDAGSQLFAAYGKLRTDACCREAPDEAAGPPH